MCLTLLTGKEEFGGNGHVGHIGTSPHTVFSDLSKNACAKVLGTLPTFALFAQASSKSEGSHKPLLPSTQKWA